MSSQKPLKHDGRQTVLLLGNYRPALTLARVLHGQGYQVICSVEGCDGGAEHCRYVDELWGHRPLTAEPEGFLEDLKQLLAERPEIEVVYPVAEEFVRVFAAHHAMLPKGPVYAMTAPDLVRACLDKLGLMSLAVTQQVPTAPFEMVHSLSEFTSAADRIGLPLVVRPEHSTERIADKKAVVCQTVADLQELTPFMAAGNRSLLLQRKVEGRRHNLYFAAQNGEIVRYLHAVILRTDMPDGTGLAVDGETIEPDPQLKEYATRLIAALGYTGVGCVQFLVNEDDGSVSFLEINPRIAGNHAVPEAAGLMLSTVAIALAQFPNKSVITLEGKPGLRYVWTAGDLMGGKIAYLRGELTVKQSWFWFCRAVSAAWQADVHMKWCWHDPLPSLFSLYEVIPSLRGVVRRVLKWPVGKFEVWHGS